MYVNMKMNVFTGHTDNHCIGAIHITRLLRVQVCYFKCSYAAGVRK